MLARGAERTKSVASQDLEQGNTAMAALPEVIPSDAETGEFKTGEFVKLSDCSPDFKTSFIDARKVRVTIK